MSTNSASQARKYYKLDLDDCIPFPTSATSPALPPSPGESWQILREVTDISPWPLRPVYVTTDIMGTGGWCVAFYCEPEFGKGIVEVGQIIAIESGMVHHFFDGQVGFRIEDPDTITVIPTNLTGLWKINKSLRDRSEADKLRECFTEGCTNTAPKKCTGCNITRYCSSECQTKDWKKHKPECKIIKTLVKWDRTDWG